MVGRYINEYKELHKQKEYGLGDSDALKYIKKRIADKTLTILDYGCGRSSLADRIGAARYDPAIREYDLLPSGRFGLITCIDVLEHIPEDELDYTLTLLAAKSNWVIFVINTKIAGNILPCGENAHCTIHEKEWWISLLGKYFKQVKYIKEWPHMKPCKFLVECINNEH